MEKKEPINSNPRGVCEKLFDAITVSPGFRQFRRISYHPQDPVPPPAATHKPPAPLAPPSVDPPVQVPGKADSQPIVPLSFAPTLKEKPLAPTPASDLAPAVKPKKKLDSNSSMKTAKVSGGFHQLQGKKEEDKKTVKVEAPERAPSTKGEGEKKGGLANINEKANDYIARARMKIRHTTTIAGGDGNARTK